MTMKPLVLAAVLCAASVHAAGPAAALHKLPADVPLRVMAQVDEGGEGEGEDEAPAEEEDDDESLEGGLDTPTAEDRAAVGEPAPSTSPSADPRAQQLVSGAPLYNPNVNVHIVQRKQISDAGKHELVVFPAIPQVNSKFTNHTGSGLSYVYHLHENFGFHFTPQFNWHNGESAFTQELINKVSQQPTAATSLLLKWGAIAGVEVAPVYGKFAWYQNSLAQYSFVLTGGAGYGDTRHQLRERNEAGPDTFGNTGGRVLGQVGAGFRVLLGERFAVRLEVRDTVYTAKVDQVNGCDVNDLTALDTAIRQGRQDLAAVPGLSASCQSRGVPYFSSTHSEGYQHRGDVPLALSLVNTPSSDVLNLVSFYGGISFIF